MIIHANLSNRLVNLHKMSKCVDSSCTCVCHHTQSQHKKTKSYRVKRDIGFQNDWKCADVFYILESFQSKYGWIPSNMFKAAKAVTMDMRTAARSTDKNQKLMWGQLLFYVYHQVEDIDSPDYRYSNGELSLEARFVDFYVRKWLVPHRAGIAKRKASSAN